MTLCRRLDVIVGENGWRELRYYKQMASEKEEHSEPEA